MHRKFIGIILAAGAAVAALVAHAPQAAAWSYAVHMISASIAFHQLTEEEQTQVICVIHATDTELLPCTAISHLGTSSLLRR